MSSQDIQSRLEQISMHRRIPYGRARSVYELEDEHRRVFSKYRGYLAQSDAFKCFFLETIELVNKAAPTKPRIRIPQSYGEFVPRLVHSFQSLCATEGLASRGYPLHGFALLRNTFDNVKLDTAALQTLTTFHAIDGIDPSTSFESRAAKKLRLKVERMVNGWISGDRSGLRTGTINELSRLDALFDDEVHGARVSRSDTTAWLKGSERLPVLPVFTGKAVALFMNRHSEIGWMTHRLVPLIQLPNRNLPDEWKHKWRVLDDGFGELVNSLTKQLGKGIGAAMVELVNAKFPYNEGSHFPL
jgi:hypothetical protein